MSMPDPKATSAEGWHLHLPSSGKIASNKKPSVVPNLVDFEDLIVDPDVSDGMRMQMLTRSTETLSSQSAPRHGLGFDAKQYMRKWDLGSETIVKVGPKPWMQRLKSLPLMNILCVTIAVTLCGAAVALAYRIGHYEGVLKTPVSVPLPSPKIPHEKLQADLNEHLDNMLHGMVQVDFWLRALAAFTWFFGMVLLHGSCITVVVSSLFLFLYPGPMYVVATIMPSMTLMMSPFYLVLIPLAVAECYWRKWHMALMSVMSLCAVHALKWYGLWVDMTVSRSQATILMGMGMSTLPLIVYIVARITVWLLGYVEIRHYPDGKKTISHQGVTIGKSFPTQWVTTIVSWFQTVPSVVQPSSIEPPKKKWKSEWNPNWRKDPAYESKTKLSFQVPFEKLCKMGYFQVLDNLTLQPVGMGFPYRGKFLTAHHVWEAIGKPRTMRIRHVCGDVVKMHEVSVVDSFVHDSDEKVDDGVVVATLPSGVKSYHQDKLYVSSREGQVACYSYLDSTVVVSMAMAADVKHWCSTSPGTSGAPVLSVMGNLVGMHTSGAGTHNVMVLSEDINEMLDVVPEVQPYSRCIDSDSESVVSEAHKGGRMGKRRRARNKPRRLPKLWTDEDYDGFLKDGWTPEELRSYAAEWWRTHPEELRAAMDDEQVSYESLVVYREQFKITMLMDDDLLSDMVHEAKNALTPQIVGGLLSLTPPQTSTTPNGDLPQKESPATPSTHGQAAHAFLKTPKGRGGKKIV